MDEVEAALGNGRRNRVSLRNVGGSVQQLAASTDGPVEAAGRFAASATARALIKALRNAGLLYHLRSQAVLFESPCAPGEDAGDVKSGRCNRSTMVRCFVGLVVAGWWSAASSAELSKCSQIAREEDTLRGQCHTTIDRVVGQKVGGP
ncbi:hypothetical protein ACIP5U_39400 [Streptomyces sp. NPDC088788]|uniref:hypothetical protein n=1 Tax=Streptomyces sp. NPDC088788 TaxID=3365898 RepID=UPI00380670A3